MSQSLEYVVMYDSKEAKSSNTYYTFEMQILQPIIHFISIAEEVPVQTFISNHLFRTLDINDLHLTVPVYT